MNSVIIFDVSDNKEAIVREQLRTMGYYTSWSSGEAPNKTTVILPHNVAWKPNTESQQAVNDLNQSINAINTKSNTLIKLLRCVVLNSTPWRAIPGNKVE